MADLVADNTPLASLAAISGPPGPTGPQGATGPQGPKGDTGPAGAGTGDMLASVYDTNGDGKVNAAATADSVPWSGVSGKPSTYPPDTHSHSISSVTGLQVALDGKQAAGSYVVEGDSRLSNSR